MNGLLAIALAALTGACGQGSDALPACEANGAAHGRGSDTVEVKWENELGCDLSAPQTLTVIIDETSWAAATGSTSGWGGDASMRWAEELVLDMGGQPIFHGGRWVEGRNVDY